MLRFLTIKNVHIISLLAVICVFVIAGIAEIHEHKAYLDLPGRTIEIGRCYYKTNFGFECPSCGLTRTFISLENFKVEDAFNYNRIGPFVYLMFIFLGIFNLLSVFKNRYALRWGKFLAIYSITTCAAIVINWLVFYFIPMIGKM